MSISGEIDRIRNNVQNTLGTIAETGVNVAAGANSNALPAAAAALANEKQNKLTGTAGQVVGFDASGNAIAQDAPSGGGVSSWNDLTDKPTEMVGGDTLTWDGNIAELVKVSVGDIYYCKISDASPTFEDLQNGLTIKLYGTEPFTVSSLDEMIQLGAITTEDGFVYFEYVVFIPRNDYETEGIYFPEAGTYFIYIEATSYTESLTIPGYTGFAQEKLKPEVLPDNVGNHVFYADMFYPIAVGSYYLFHDAARTVPLTVEDAASVIQGGKGIVIIFNVGETPLMKIQACASALGQNADGTEFIGVMIYVATESGINVYNGFSAEYVPPTT